MFPELAENWIDGAFVPVQGGQTVDNLNPATGDCLGQLARSGPGDVKAAVEAARCAQPAWAATPAVQRGLQLLRLVRLLEDHVEELAEIVAKEGGKRVSDARGEAKAAIQCGLFFASEGQRLYGQTCTSGAANKLAMTVRRPLGVAGLIIAANTPAPNVAWKLFPALICGNAVVLKAAEDSPACAWLFAKLSGEAGFPPGVINVVQGLGAEAGQALAEAPGVDVISFTGSTQVGRIIQRATIDRFVRLSLELGGKNPLIVCDDADLDNACNWVMAAAFSNAGQRCASASRIIIFDKVYDAFREKLIVATEKLKLGVDESDDVGPVINERQQTRILEHISKAVANGGKVVTGGADAPRPERGFFVPPTLLENVSASAAIAREELFGPVAVLYRAKDFDDALAQANDCDYGLTASLHTSSVHRAMLFPERIRAGVAVINAGTHGSEPHMPFGGFGPSGNGTREPGTQALDVYSELQDVYMVNNPAAL